MKRIFCHLVMMGKESNLLLISFVVVFNSFIEIYNFFRSLCLWSAMKKKPLYIQEMAHGRSVENREANWISSIATLINADIIASG